MQLCRVRGVQRAEADGNPYELLRPVYVVSFLNFRLKHKEGTVWDTDNFISYWQFEEKRTKEVADQTISVIFAEMALFTKTPEECRTELDRLFYIFKNSGGFSSIPEWISESGGVSRRLAEACEVAAFDKEKKIKYKIDKMNEWDLQAKIVYAEKKGRSEGRTEGLEEGRTEGLELGLKEGRELGREEGIEEGKELGREEGRELGREEAQLSIARKLLEAGTPVDVIATCTGLAKSVIESIAKESGSAD
jgi:predicted transposase/invertase (TIGR01784 family)